MPRAGADAEAGGAPEEEEEPAREGGEEGWEVPRGLQSGAARRAADECEAEEALPPQTLTLTLTLTLTPTLTPTLTLT